MKMRLSFCLFLILLTFTLSAKSDLPLIELKNWLVLGPVNGDNPYLDKLSPKEILNKKRFDIHRLKPRSGESITWQKGTLLRWNTLKSPLFKLGKGQVIYFATYIQTDRWVKTDLLINNLKNPFSVYLNGKLLKSIKKNSRSATILRLDKEKHLLIVKLVGTKGDSFQFSPFLKLNKVFKDAKISTSISHHHYVNIINILNLKTISNLSLSPDRKYAMVNLIQPDLDSGKANRWTDIIQLSNGKTLYSSRPFGTIQNAQWLNSRGKFSYTIRKKQKTSMFIYDLNSHSKRPVLVETPDFSEYHWAPDNSFFIYSRSMSTPKPKDYTHVIELPARGKSSDIKSALYIVYINRSSEGLSSVTHQLTDFSEDYSQFSISPDSKKVIIAKYLNDYQVRPYIKMSSKIIDLGTGKISPFLDSNWIRMPFIWSPDSTAIAFISGPSTFNNMGKNLSKETIPNDYDGQVYHYNIKSKMAKCLTKTFKPSVNTIFWSSRSILYFKVTDQSYSRLYSYNLQKHRFKKINSLVDYVNHVDIKQRTAIYSGSSTGRYPKLYINQLGSGSVRVLKDYNQTMFKDVQFGKCIDWDFTSSAKRVVKGRLYFPPNFDPKKKYPCIVYYYGGTSPVTREYGGRYPKNWYAANGYIVYVLQPTGATGFGQKASSVHVNDWGRVTSKEIIEGVDKLIAAHPYINPKGIGSMGASYGGFLTQYLATQTDKIAAFISHAGISDLSSYWGEGEWGYLYSGVASAGSFPWNRKDLYVGHSPLYMVDRIVNPILLLHGDIDNNVPPGESYQMYAALKLAGKEAELITFKGQRHFILEYKKRIRWMKTIIAWFDKWLKNEPEHWNYLYKKP